MSDQSREQFEAAVINRMRESGFLAVEVRVEMLGRSGDDYDDPSVSAYWHFWNESRDTLVVELPPAPEEPEEPEEAIDDSYLDAYHAATEMRTGCAKAIEATGAQVTP